MTLLDHIIDLIPPCREGDRAPADGMARGVRIPLSRGAQNDAAPLPATTQQADPIPVLAPLVVTGAASVATILLARV